MGKCCLFCGIHVLYFFELDRVSPKESTTVGMCMSCIEVLRDLIKKWRGQSIDENWEAGWGPNIGSLDCKA